MKMNVDDSRKQELGGSKKAAKKNMYCITPSTVSSDSSKTHLMSLKLYQFDVNDSATDTINSLKCRIKNMQNKN